MRETSTFEGNLNEGIKVQYQILAELTKVDEKITRLQNELTRLPQEVGRLESALAVRRDAFQAIKTEFDSAEKNIRKLEQELKEREDHIKKAEGKMMEVKTNTEYQAAMKENEGVKKEKGVLEEQVLSLLSVLDENKGHLKTAENEYLTYESTVKKEKQQHDDDRKKIEGELGTQLKQRAQIAERLSPEIADMYLKIAGRAQGVAVVGVENGQCMGCHMRVRPQQYNEVIGFKLVHRCASCGRILIKFPEGQTPAPVAG